MENLRVKYIDHSLETGIDFKRLAWSIVGALIVCTFGILLAKI